MGMVRQPGRQVLNRAVGTRASVPRRRRSARVYGPCGRLARCWVRRRRWLSMCAPSTCTEWATSTSPSPIAIGRWRPRGSGQESVPSDLAAGDEVVVATAANMIVAIERSPALKDTLAVSRSGLRPAPARPCERLAEVAQPVVLSFGHEPHAPRERVAAAACDPRLDQGVEHPTFRQPQSGHGRHAERREGHPLVGADHAPAHRAAEPMLGLVGDLHAPGSRVLPEPADARGERRCAASRRSRPRPSSGGRDRADDQDLVPVGA